MRQKLAWAMIAVLAAVLVQTTLPSDASAATTRKILFVQRGDIYAINPGGTGLVRLTRTANNGQPTWAPGGARFAFVSIRDGDMEIFTMNANGTGQRKLTNNTRTDTHPSWSPDGTRLAFVRDFTFERYGDDPTKGAALWTMRADGSLQRRQAIGTGGAIEGFHELFYDPVWSPNGRFIAGTGIEWMPTQDNALTVRKVATGDAALSVAGHYTTPAWAPNGDAIGCSYDGLYRFPLQGDPTLLMGVNDHSQCQYPSMSGGSKFVAYVKDGVLRGRDLVTFADRALAILGPYGYGSGTWYCSSNCSAVRHPYDWSPDGRLMVAATPDGLRVVAPDNSYSKLLPVWGTDPSW